MATLKISELSVGDWVQDGYGDYVKVAGIWQGCNFNYQVDILRDGRIGTIVPCNLYPIPITAEILEKNGFEDTMGDAFWISTSCNLLWEDGKLQNFCREEDDEVCIPCEYVHELQNALRLCKVDKEIVL